MWSKLDGPGLLLLNGFFPSTRFRATESGIDCRVFGVVDVVPSLMSIASWLAVSITAVRSAGMWHGAAAGQPADLTRAKAGHLCCEGCHGLGFFLAEVSSEPLVTDIMLKSR